MLAKYLPFFSATARRGLASSSQHIPAFLATNTKKVANIASSTIDISHLFSLRMERRPPFCFLTKNMRDASLDSGLLKMDLAGHVSILGEALKFDHFEIVATCFGPGLRLRRKISYFKDDQKWICCPSIDPRPVIWQGGSHMAPAADPITVKLPKRRGSLLLHYNEVVPTPQNHPTLECQISVHIGPRKLQFFV